MGTVTVKYIGPGSDTDKRELKVSEEEAERLLKKKLWARKTKKRSTTNG